MFSSSFNQNLFHWIHGTTANTSVLSSLLRQELRKHGSLVTRRRSTASVKPIGNFSLDNSSYTISVLCMYGTSSFLDFSLVSLPLSVVLYAASSLNYALLWFLLALLVHWWDLSYRGRFYYSSYPKCCSSTHIHFGKGAFVWTCDSDSLECWSASPTSWNTGWIWEIPALLKTSGSGPKHGGILNVHYEL